MNFELTKKVNDIQEVQLVPEGWYSMEIVDEPTLEPNKTMREQGPSVEKAGYNLVIDLAITNAEPEYNGRQFRKWLSFPGVGDSERYAAGQSIEDFKLTQIIEFVRAFGVEIKEKTFSLKEGMSAQFYVIQEVSQDGTTLRNSLDFNTLPKPIGFHIQVDNENSEIPF